MKAGIAVGLIVACAVAVAGASSASAAETTAWTCVAGGSGGAGTKFSDADCTKEAFGGASGHSEIPASTLTEAKAKKITNFVFKTIIAGASVTLEATGVECLGCGAENVGFGASMEVSGEGFGLETMRLRFTGVTVASAPKKCVVVQGSSEGVIETDPLRFQTVGTNEIRIKPGLAIAHLAVFSIFAASGETCAPAGPVIVDGDINVTSVGAIATVNVPATSKTLKVGPNGASLTGQATIEVGKFPTYHPAALT